VVGLAVLMFIRYIMNVYDVLKIYRINIRVQDGICTIDYYNIIHCSAAHFNLMDICIVYISVK
jgi:hypothetical protein